MEISKSLTCLVVVLLTVNIGMPLQFVFAEDDEENNFFKFLTKNTKDVVGKIVEAITDEDRLRDAIKISEEYALKLSQELGYDFSKNYFENYKDLDVKDLTLEHILLTVIHSFNIEQYSDILSENPFLRQFEIEKLYEKTEKTKQEIREQFDFFGTYDKDAWEIIEKNTQRMILAKYSDQSSVDELYKPRSLSEEAAITLIQATPSYDPKTGQLTTLDNSAREMVQKIPAFEGTDLEKDPIRSGVLLVNEPDYTMKAKLIKTEDGHVISLEEALFYDYKNEDVAKAQLALEILDAGMDMKKIDHPDKKAQEFRDLIEKINNEKELLIP